MASDSLALASSGEVTEITASHHFSLTMWAEAGLQSGYVDCALPGASQHVLGLSVTSVYIPCGVTLIYTGQLFCFKVQEAFLIFQLASCNKNMCDWKELKGKTLKFLVTFAIWKHKFSSVYLSNVL